MERFQSVLKALFYPLWFDDSILNRIRTFQKQVESAFIFSDKLPILVLVGKTVHLSVPELF